MGPFGLCSVCILAPAFPLSRIYAVCVKNSSGSSCPLDQKARAFRLALTFKLEGLSIRSVPLWNGTTPFAKWPQNERLLSRPPPSAVHCAWLYCLDQEN